MLELPSIEMPVPKKPDESGEVDADKTSPKDSSGVHEIGGANTIPRPEMAAEMLKIQHGSRNTDRLADPLLMTTSQAAVHAAELAQIDRDIQEGEDRAYMEGRAMRVAKGLPGDFEEPIPQTLRSSQMPPIQASDEFGFPPSSLEVGSIHVEGGLVSDEELGITFDAPEVQGEDSHVRVKPHEETGTDAAAV